MTINLPPRLLIFDDYKSLSRVAAEMLIFIGREAITERGLFTLALSGGGTPQRLFEFLARAEYAEQISWPQTYIFWGDERCVPPDQEGSSYKQANDTFLSKVSLPVENIHRIRGELPPEQAAEDYARQLREFTTRLPKSCEGYFAGDFGSLGGRLDYPRFDLVLLGMGSDGHTASLFPGPISNRERTAPTLPVTAHYQDRPANRVTLTPLIFNAARNIFFLVTGAGKAETLKVVLDGPDDPERLPAQRIQPVEGQVTWFVDQEAGRLLPEVRS